MNPRRVEAELLDRLPTDAPTAIAARKDLRRINAWMGNPRIMARMLLRNVGDGPPRSLIDLGAGDGTFCLRLARHLAPRWQRVTVTLVDQQDIVTDATKDSFAALGWKVETTAMDVLKFLKVEGRDTDGMIANLFLHHFTADPLRDLLALVARRASFFTACEPRRNAVGLAGTSLLWAIGCNAVTRHDARVSVNAGFNGHELGALWPDADGWRLDEQARGMFTHAFVACRSARSER